MKYLTQLILVIIVAAGLSACTVKYRFTGAAINPEVKTISIAYFPNRAPIVYPSLSQDITEKLKDKFISQTSLNMINSDGDLSFEGEITGYETKPIAITGNNIADKASLNRLTVTINVRFVNTKVPKDNFETKFQAFEDYSSDKGLDEVEGELVPLILEKIIEDIFNRSVVNW